MKTLLVIAFVSGRLLLGCNEADGTKDAGEQPPDASHVDARVDAEAEDDAGTPDAAAHVTTDAAVDGALPPTCPQPRQLPFPEICNAFDDDCDGRMDEGACSDPCDETW